MTKKGRGITMSKLTKIILGIVAITLVGLCGYVLGLRNNTTKTSATTTTTVKSTSAITSINSTNLLTTTTTDAIADWKTYTNTDYGFSFKYPRDWETKSRNTIESTAKLEIVSAPKNIGDSLFGVSIKKTTLQKEIELVKNIFAQNSTFLGTDAITFANEQTTKLSFQNNTDNTIKPVIYIIDNNDYIYILNGEGSSNDLNVNQILSTFKFTQ